MKRITLISLIFAMFTSAFATATLPEIKPLSIDEFHKSSAPYCCGGFETPFALRLGAAYLVPIAERQQWEKDWYAEGYSRLFDKLNELAPVLAAKLDANRDITVEKMLVEVAKGLNVNAMSPVAIASVDSVALIISIHCETNKMDEKLCQTYIIPYAK